MVFSPFPSVADIELNRAERTISFLSRDSIRPSRRNRAERTISFGIARSHSGQEGSIKFCSSSSAVEFSEEFAFFRCLERAAILLIRSVT